MAIPWGAIISGAASLGSSIFSSLQNNKNIDKQLNKQTDENAKNREYNLQLAKLQNQWNISQWNNENAYNSPAAQIERMKEAGLNPDMMYGGGVSGNLAASSPSMTSGSSAAVQDWSALSSKKTIGDSFGAFLDAELKQKHIDLLDRDIKDKDVKLKYSDAREKLGLSITEQEFEKNKLLIKDLYDKLETNKVQLQIQSNDYLLKQCEYAFRTQEADMQLKILSNQLKLSNTDVAHMVEAKVLELAGKDLDNKLKSAQLKWDDPQILENLGGEGFPAFVKLLLMILK